ncbi:hypothetical protein [Candidatus Nanohalovita haloferacivicina]|uniref:hypothetical protein n=1 Tax=Candidatus Nanohalovita haloferacivicina TaxID=2978046 RepID=UPI00325FAC16|nr:hypothetical protein HBNXNv_0415 [Candidatus Nanohalobia archaeon BNXNv]
MADFDLPQVLEGQEGTFRRAEADLLREQFDSYDEKGEILLGDGKNLYRLTPSIGGDEEYSADCVGVLNPDTYSRIMEEASEVFPGEDSFKVVADFIRSDEAYWDPEKREFLGEDDSFYDSSAAENSIRQVVADGDQDYSSPAERDWSQIRKKL